MGATGGSNGANAIAGGLPPPVVMAPPPAAGGGDEVTAMFIIGGVAGQAEGVPAAQGIALPQQLPPDVAAELARFRATVPKDLCNSTVLYTRLLHAVDTFPNGGLYEGKYAELAVQRYLGLWLPMLAATADPSDLIPPLDIAWVWLVHRLNPTRYEADCLRLHGKVLDASPKQAFRFSDGTNLAGREMTATKAAWLARNFKKEGRVVKLRYPYYPPTPGTPPLITPPAGYPTRGAYEYLVGGLPRQAKFLHSVLRSAYLHEAFLNQAHDRYCKFLLLAKRRPDLMVVPMYDIDLMWHTHMALSQGYRDVSRALLGKVMSHDDSLPETKLSEAYLKCKAAYEELYGELYNPPITCAVPAEQPHPITVRFAPLLKFYESPATRAKARAAGGLKSAGGLLPGWRPGGHAMYLMYLLDRGVKVKSEGGLSCFPRSQQTIHKKAARFVAKCAAKFCKFKNLPHSDTHPYWQSIAMTHAAATATPVGAASGVTNVAPVVTVVPLSVAAAQPPPMGRNEYDRDRFYQSRYCCNGGYYWPYYGYYWWYTDYMYLSALSYSMMYSNYYYCMPMPMDACYSPTPGDVPLDGATGAAFTDIGAGGDTTWNDVGTQFDSSGAGGGDFSGGIYTGADPTYGGTNTNNVDSAACTSGGCANGGGTCGASACSGGGGGGCGGGGCGGGGGGG